MANFEYRNEVWFGKCDRCGQEGAVLDLATSIWLCPREYELELDKQQAEAEAESQKQLDKRDFDDERKYGKEQGE